MKKKKQKPRKSNRKQVQAAPEPTRRDMLKLARNGAIGVAVLGGGGYLALGAVRAGAAEYDLTRIGNGKPAVVQIHDPQCPTCTALQKQTRKALRNFDKDELVYLVANIKQTQGQALAARYGVAHVTLLLFDGAGNLQNTLRGMRQSDELQALFAQHLETHS